jgi:hypothetical protein
MTCAPLDSPFLLFHTPATASETNLSPLHDKGMSNRGDDRKERSTYSVQRSKTDFPAWIVGMNFFRTSPRMVPAVVYLVRLRRRRDQITSASHLISTHASLLKPFSSTLASSAGAACFFKSIAGAAILIVDDIEGKDSKMTDFAPQLVGSSLARMTTASQQAPS